MDSLAEAYEEMESLLEDFREQWEGTKMIAGRKENYWQGKKDGLRIAMNLICPFVMKEREELGDRS